MCFDDVISNVSNEYTLDCLCLVTLTLLDDAISRLIWCLVTDMVIT